MKHVQLTHRGREMACVVSTVAEDLPPPPEPTQRQTRPARRLRRTTPPLSWSHLQRILSERRSGCSYVGSYPHDFLPILSLSSAPLAVSRVPKNFDITSAGWLYRCPMGNLPYRRVIALAAPPLSLPSAYLSLSVLLSLCLPPLPSSSLAHGLLGHSWTT